FPFLGARPAYLPVGPDLDPARPAGKGAGGEGSHRPRRAPPVAGAVLEGREPGSGGQGLPQGAGGPTAGPAGVAGIRGVAASFAEIEPARVEEGPRRGTGRLERLSGGRLGSDQGRGG